MDALYFLRWWLGIGLGVLGVHILNIHRGAAWLGILAIAYGASHALTAVERIQQGEARRAEGE